MVPLKRPAGSGVLVSNSIMPLKTDNFDAIKIGIIIQTREGKSRYPNKWPVVTLLAIHNIVVVTSPIGEKAPPALAAITISPANQRRIFRLCIIFWSNEIRTIVAVKLSIIADNINANMAKIQSSFDFFLV